MRRICDEWLRGRTGDLTLYNLLTPERAQRNVVFDMRHLTPRPDHPIPIRDELYPKVDLHGRDQVRVLVCEGARLLAWVGAFRPEPFGARERRLLGRLVPALQRRLALERRLGDGRHQMNALAAALEALGSAAFILDGGGAIQHLNASARALVERDRRGLRAALHEAVARPTAARRFEVTTIRSRGLPEHYLAVERTAPPDGGSRLSAAARRWRLTPRQSEVLCLVARGDANKIIAATLGCAERTVELHVTAILAKAGVDGRTALVAKVWSAF
jgi:DNA-binding NarL/FixJ family response regulator